jgi:hypothetical protein
VDLPISMGELIVTKWLDAAFKLRSVVPEILLDPSNIVELEREAS